MSLVILTGGGFSRRSAIIIITAHEPHPLRAHEAACRYPKPTDVTALGTDSTDMFDGKPTRSAGPPAVRAPKAARQQERYGGQRDMGRADTMRQGISWWRAAVTDQWALRPDQDLSSQHPR